MSDTTDKFKEEMDEDAIRLPRQASDMVDFIIEVFQEAKRLNLPPKAMLEAAHDYICYWIHADDADPAPDEVVSIPITNKRLN